MTKNLLNTLIFLIIFSAIYRIIPNRPWGFVPQFSMTLFGGYLFSHEKKWSFFLPIMSLFIGDMFYHILYLNNISPIPGFYDGQLLNYGLFIVATFFGFGLNPSNNKDLLFRSLLGPTSYFLLSNLIVWVSGGGYHRTTLIECYIDGLPFYINSILGSLFFTYVMFGSYIKFKKTNNLNYENKK